MRPILLAFVAAALLAGCGVKGPLVLPPAAQPAPAPMPTDDSKAAKPGTAR